MDPLSAKNVKILLEKHGASPKKQLGQNFLIDNNVLAKIIESADLTPDDVVLEVGPGLGVLTMELAKNCKKVIAVEKDEKLAEILKSILEEQNVTNVEIVKGDALKMTNTPHQNLRFGAGQAKYKVVANLPYYITAPVIRKFLESDFPPESMVLMVQKEVGQRICAKPPRPRQNSGGQAKMNLLAVSVQFYASPEIVSFVSKKSFWPRPKVDSALIRIDPQINTDKKTDSRRFFQIAKAGFSQPRKQILNNFQKGLKLNKTEAKNWLDANGINAERRAETLSIDEWINLSKTAPIIPP